MHQNPTRYNFCLHSYDMNFFVQLISCTSESTFEIQKNIKKFFER